MDHDTLPSVELLRELLNYDRETGILTWLSPTTVKSIATRWNNTSAGTPHDGYIKVMIKKVGYRSHRIAWAMETGKWPIECIDHINGNRADNRISNLRVVSVAENARNKRLHKNNTSGTCGVYWSASIKKWVSIINHCGQRKFLGNFTQKQSAVKARKLAEREFGFHQNHGRAN